MIKIIQEDGNFGYNRYNSLHQEIRVVIHHRVEDGYKLSADKEMIREELPFRGFMSRFDRILPIEKIKDVEQRVNTIFQTNHMSALESIQDWLDYLYATMIHEGKIILAQHGIKREDYQSEKNFTKYSAQKYPKTPDESYKKPKEITDIKDEDIYYLLTV